MDRVSVRSFRAHDLAERGLKDLARSRLDTTREVVFQPLGARFFEAREDVVRLANLFREDAFHAPAGQFARMTLRVEPQLAERLAALEPRAVEARLEEAARNAILRELPRVQGAYLVRFESSPREGLEPVGHVYLSSRRLDGGPLQALTREDAQRFDGVWSREVGRAFNLEHGQIRDLERGPALERATALAPATQRLRDDWFRASARLYAAYNDRLTGKATQKDVADALAQVRVARAAWSREVGPSVNLRDIEARQVFDVLRLRIEGGSRYFRGPLEAERRSVLELAASRAAGLPDEKEGRLAVVSWPAGRDLHATVYLNQRAQPERAPGSLDPELLTRVFQARLTDEIRRLAPSLDPTAGSRSEELGRVEAQVQERTGQHARTVADPERAEVHNTPSITVVLNSERDPADREASRSILESQPPLESLERDWLSERVFAVRLQVPTGGEQLQQAGLSGEEAAHVVQRAVDRAYPFLEREGIRDNFLYSSRGQALQVQLLVPEKLGWSRDQLRSPQFQQRFMAGFHQALAQIAPTRLGPAKEPLIPGLARAVGTARQVPQMLREAEQDPERAAKDRVRAAFGRLSEVLPKPFRMMQELGRTVSRFRSRGE